jgi:hypothetical protein
MGKPVIGFLVCAAISLSGMSALAENRTLDAEYNSVADWAVSEGYGLMRVDGKVVFCQPDLTTGTHVRMNQCVDRDELVARWESWKTGPRAPGRGESDRQPRRLT